MNLVCQEYAACKVPPNSDQTNNQQGGVLILSEFCGAAQSLSGALMVNPWNTADVAEAIHTALTMSPQERQAFTRLKTFLTLLRIVNRVPRTD